MISADPAAVRTTVGAVLADRAARDPGRPSLECDRVVLGYAEVPRYVEFVDALPKTPNEKVQKYRLRETGVAGAWDRDRAGGRVAR